MYPNIQWFETHISFQDILSNEFTYLHVSMILRQTSIFKVRHYFINDVSIYPNIQWFKTHTHTHIFIVHQELICIHVYVWIQDFKAHLIFETWDTTLSSMHPNIQWIKIHIHFQGISNAKILHLSTYIQDCWKWLHISKNLGHKPILNSRLVVS